MSSLEPEQPPKTGHPVIDDTLAELDLTGPVNEHAAGFERVQAVLQQVLNPTSPPAA